MKSAQEKIPKSSVLLNNNYHYVDCYSMNFEDVDNSVEISDIGKAFFSSAPKWIERLFNLRNKIAGVLGLKTGDKSVNKEQQLSNFRCEEGEKLGLFLVYHKSENEVVLGENDKHLNFRISLLQDCSEKPGNKKVTITTTVHFNNWFGKLYFLPVKPFHKIIAPLMLKGIIREVKKKIK